VPVPERHVPGSAVTCTASSTDDDVDTADCEPALLTDGVEVVFKRQACEPAEPAGLIIPLGHVRHWPPVLVGDMYWFPGQST